MRFLGLTLVEMVKKFGIDLLNFAAKRLYSGFSEFRATMLNLFVEAVTFNSSLIEVVITTPRTSYIKF